VSDPVLERIRWIDSHSAGGIWLDVSALPHSMPVTEIETVGWVLHDEDDRLIVACSRSLDGEQVGEVIAIVKPAVKSREVLK
jgi:hypothetical protein